jgi:hypothetical protein
VGYIQNDWNFNIEVWDGVESGIKEYLKQEGVAIVNAPIDIPVDP